MKVKCKHFICLIFPYKMCRNPQGHARAWRYLMITRVEPRWNENYRKILNTNLKPTSVKEFIEDIFDVSLYCHVCYLLALAAIKR